MRTQTLASQPDPAGANLGGHSKRASYSRHRRKCAICSHPRRQAIEQAFLLFRSPSVLASRIDLSRRTIYHHVRALFPRRNRRLAHSLELIMEKADRFQPTPNDIINAVDRYRKIDYDSFEKISTPKTKQIVIQNETALEACLQSNPSMRTLIGDTTSSVSSVQPPNPDLKALISNRHTSKLKFPVSHSKQRTATQSNRHKLRGRHAANSSMIEGVRPK